MSRRLKRALGAVFGTLILVLLVGAVPERAGGRGKAPGRHAPVRGLELHPGIHGAPRAGEAPLGIERAGGKATTIAASG